MLAEHVDDERLDRELSGLDHLEQVGAERPPLGLRLWVSAWPKLAAVGLVLAVWQFVVWREWKPRFVLPAPLDVGRTLWHDLGTSELWNAVAHTMRRAVIGFLVSLLVGGVLGLAVSRSRVLRVAVGSMITGLQTMPAWQNLHPRVQPRAISRLIRS